MTNPTTAAYITRLRQAFEDGIRNARPAAERKKQLAEGRQRRKFKRKDTR